MSAPLPYKTTAIFDEQSLPAALRGEHRTKAGVWGVIRVLDGRLRLAFADGSAERVLTASEPGLIFPEQVHKVEPLGPMRMQVEFYDRPPVTGSSTPSSAAISAGAACAGASLAAGASSRDTEKRE